MSDTPQEQQQLQIDPNHVITSLLQQNAELAKGKAIAEAAFQTLQDALQKAQKDYADSQVDESAAKPSKQKSAPASS